MGKITRVCTRTHFGTVAMDQLVSIKDIQEKWNLSRQTIQNAIKNKQIQGTKDPKTKRWQFEFAEVLRWRGEPWTNPVPIAEPEKEADPEIIGLLKKQIEDQKALLERQLEDKDQEIQRLSVQLDRKDEQIKHHQRLLEGKNEQGWFKKVFG